LAPPTAPEQLSAPLPERTKAAPITITSGLPPPIEADPDAGLEPIDDINF